ncbi:MAG: cobalamin B12-binding domain-containing protein [Thermoproteota archaeon]
MNQEKILTRLKDAVVEMRADEARKAAEEALKEGIDPAEAIVKGLSEGMKVVGERFGRMEIFLSEVLASADAYYAALNVLRPKMSKERAQSTFIATLVIGTIFGDIHTVGKDVAIPVFQSAGFNVIDLGIDVPPEKFVEAAIDNNAELVGLGTYMSETFFHVPEVVDAFKRAGIRERVKIICGGPAVDPETARRLGADDASNDAWEAVEKMKKLLKDLRGR